MSRLLFDQNLSSKLVALLQEIFPNSAHVKLIGLITATDREIWNYAHQHNLIIVSRDVDFSDISLISGFPPKVVWIRRGNCATRDLARLLRENKAAIDALEHDDENGILILY